MDVKTLKKAIEESFDDETKKDEDDVDIKVDHIFGDGHPCDVQERSNEWITDVIKGLLFCVHVLDSKIDYFYFFFLLFLLLFYFLNSARNLLIG